MFRNERFYRVLDESVREILETKFGVSGAATKMTALNEIHRGLKTAVSIDAFIHRNRANPDIALFGKLLIVLEIIDAERRSNMHPDVLALHEGDPRFKTADDTWIGSFMRILFNDVSDVNEVGKGISIICFNYDRCLEYYLVNAITVAYHCTDEVAQQVVANMEIIHPYGTVGRLPWTANQRYDNIVSFGAEIDSRVDWLKVASESIKTYTEQTHNAFEVKRVHEAISHANVLVSLGFGFANQNLDLLRVKQTDTGITVLPEKIYVSGKGLAKQTGDTFKRRIGNLYPKYEDRELAWQRKIEIEHDATCSQLFSIHWPHLERFIERYVDEGTGMVVHIRK